MAQETFQFASKTGDFVENKRGNIGIVNFWTIHEGPAKEVRVFWFVNWIHRLFLKKTFFDKEINQLTPARVAN